VTIAFEKIIIEVDFTLSDGIYLNILSAEKTRVVGCKLHDKLATNRILLRVLVHDTSTGRLPMGSIFTETGIIMRILLLCAGI